MSNASRATKCFSRSTACAGADQPAGAAPRHHAGLAHCETAANRAVIRKLVRLGFRRPALAHDPDNLRDHVTGALNDNGVADPHILARNLVFVVQGGALHDNPADGDRFERRDRSQCALTPDRDQNIAQHGLRLLGGEFVRQCPAWGAADHAEPLLQ